MLILAVAASLRVLPALAQSTPSPSQPVKDAPALPAAVATSAASSTAPPAAPPAPTLSSARTRFREGDFDDAISEYNALLKTPGYDPALCYAGLAGAYLKQHKVDDAFTAATKAVQLAPTYPATQATMGEVLFRQGKIPEAEKIFIGLIRADAPYARAFYDEAVISSASLYRKQAKQLIDRAYQMDPSDPEIWEFYLQTLSGSDRVKALQDYLAAKNNDDVRDHAHLQHELAVLQDDMAHPTHPCRLTSNVTSMESDLKLLLYDANHMRAVGLPVKLNDASSVLEFDTGAGGILVDRKIAEKAGVQKIVDVQIGGIGDKGDAEGYIGHVDTIRIGALEFKDCDVQVMNQNSVVESDGLIGGNVFAHFLVDLDMPDKKFRLSQLPPLPDDSSSQPVSLDSRPSRTQPHLYNRYVAPDMKSYTPVYRFGHDLVIPTLLNGSNLKLFVIDTGAFGNTISPAAAREVSKVSRDAGTKIKGISGDVKNVYRVNQVKLTFGNLSQRNEDLVAFDTSAISNDVGTEISGFLGFSTLAMIDMKIDYRDGLVDFQFNANRYCHMDCQ